MKKTKMTATLVLALSLMVWTAEVSEAAPMGTAFTYQSRLMDKNQPAEGSYDFQFKLYDSNDPCTGTQLASPIDINDVEVIDGHFIVELDFGSGIFDGNAVWLETRVVRSPMGSDPATLSPLLELTPTPYALYAATTDWDNLNNVPAGFLDGVDNDTLYIAGEGLLLSGTTFAADTSYLQRRVSTSCPVGTFISAIDAYGNVVCIPDSDTLYIAGEGLLLSGTTFAFSSLWGDSRYVNKAGDTMSGSLFVDGNIGIGTASPTAKLDVAGTVNATAFVGDGSGLTGIAGDSDWTISGDNMYSAIFGNVGIGTMSPTEQLDVAGNIKASGTITSGDSITIDGAGGGEKIASSDALELHVNSTRALRLEPSGNISFPDSHNLVGGFNGNIVTNGAAGATVAGGGAINFINRATDRFGAIGGGWKNQVGNDNADPSDAGASTVGGGTNNTASGQVATIGGGLDNIASAHAATVGGGQENIVSGWRATVPGGYKNTAAGANSYAAGWRAKAKHIGAFVWADCSIDANFVSTASNQFLIRASGGVGIGTNNPTETVDVNGTVKATAFVGDGSGLTGMAADSDWTISSSDMYSMPLGNVGIGTTSPAYKLDVNGDLRVTGSLIGTATNAARLDGYEESSFFQLKQNEVVTGRPAFNGGVSGSSPPFSVDSTYRVRNLNADLLDGLDSSSFSSSAHLHDTRYFTEGESDSRFVNVTGDTMSGGLNIGGNVGIGTVSPSEKLDVNGDMNISSAYKIRGSTVLSVTDTNNTHVGVGAGENNTADSGTFVGYNAGYNNQNNYNTFIGDMAGYSNTTGAQNTFLGWYAGRRNTTGHSNTFSGHLTGVSNTTGYFNTFSGHQAGYSNTTGNSNTFVGINAGASNTIGHNNIFLGVGAGSRNTTGFYNTFLGAAAGQQNTTGTYNTSLGHWAGYSNTTGTGNVFIGYRAGYYETGSNKLYIANGPDDSNTLMYGDFSTGRIGIGTTNPGRILDVDGHIRLRGGAVSNPGVWLTDSADVEEWFVGKTNIGGKNQIGMYKNNWKMVVQDNGSVGIGTTAPNGRLQVIGDEVRVGNAGTINYTTGDGDLYVEDTLEVDGRIFVLDAYNTGVSGRDVYVASNGELGYVLSSKKYKENIAPLKDDFSKILQAQPVTFTAKESKERGLGFIAEDMDELGLSNLVLYDAQGKPESVRYDWVSLYLLEVLKDQDESIKDLRAENESLEQRLEVLERTVQQLTQGKEFEL